MKRLLTLAATSAVLAASFVPGVDAAAVRAKPCGLTTLDGTINAATDPEVIAEGKLLKCGPGEALVVREDIVKASGGRLQSRTPLTAFFSIADVQLADEESPARGEWADECDEHPATGAFRPQETMVPHLLNGHARAANAIAQVGSPVLGARMKFALTLGDLADSNLLNEIRWIIDILDGHQIVDPDSGDDGYHGVQKNDPTGAPDHPFEVPSVAQEGERIVDLANEPFWAVGLRPGGKRLPWYSLPGNHDVKVQGTIPQSSSSNTEDPWRAFVDAYAQGSLKLFDAPQEKQEFCDNPSPQTFAEIVQGTPPEAVPSDENRTLLERHQWIDEHFETAGLPKGHGYGGERCTDDEGEPLERACYAFSDGKFRFVALDTAADEGFETGNIDDPQFQWLERELIAHSRDYFDADGNKQRNKRGRNKLIVLFTHHTISSTTNSSRNPRRPQEETHTGGDLEGLLLRFPNVILQASGHTHQNKIWPHENEDLGTGYWEINNSAIVDAPFQSRTIEIADNRDGTLSIFAVVFDAAAPPNARALDFVRDDPTNEVRLSGGKVKRAMNETWFASVGREVGFYDPQADLTKIGEPEDRNVELVVKRPFRLAGKGGPAGKGPTAGKGARVEDTGSKDGAGGTGTGAGVLGATASATEASSASLAATGATITLALLAAMFLVALGLFIRRVAGYLAPSL